MHVLLLYQESKKASKKQENIVGKSFFLQLKFLFFADRRFLCATVYQNENGCSFFMLNEIVGGSKKYKMKEDLKLQKYVLCFVYFSTAAFVFWNSHSSFCHFFFYFRVPNATHNTSQPLQDYIECQVKAVKRSLFILYEIRARTWRISSRNSMEIPHLEFTFVP